MRGAASLRSENERKRHARSKHGRVACAKEEEVPDAVVERAVVRLHKALSHCSRADLLRVLMHGGASEKALRCARSLGRFVFGLGRLRVSPMCLRRSAMRVSPWPGR